MSAFHNPIFRFSMYIYIYIYIYSTVALGSTQPVREMSTRNLPGGKKRSVRRADNLAAIYEPNV
jgi:hypothetical protein